MASPYMPVQITPSAPPRGTGAQDPTPFFAQATVATFAWGSQPGSANIIYIGNAPVTAGALIRIDFGATGAHLFYGLCISDTVKDGADGKTRTLEFRDLREFLQWDYVYCAFNKTDVRLINGVRMKRYWHIYPSTTANNGWNNYNAWIKTYTFAPLTAYQILVAIMGSATIGSPWSWDAGTFLNLPIYDFDALGGKRLDAALSELSERTGTVFTLNSSDASPYHLTWTRKGYGSLGDFPTNSDQRRVGVALSGHPTRIRILGDRNLYQVMDLAMAKDWVTAWEQFATLDRFADDIFLRGSNQRNGVRFNAYPGDTQQYSGRQDAYARALEITVREYVALRNDAAFADYRMYAGRNRMDIPCASYINTLLFRAFRPAGDTLWLPGRTMRFDSLDISDHLLCRASHNPQTGAMTWFVGEPVAGNGYAIALGYQVGADFFKTLNSDQFNVNMFTAGAAVWQHIPFQIDDSGEGVRFIIFDDPVIVSNDLLLDLDGHKVINAAFTLTVPTVRAALVFEAERYSFVKGNPDFQTGRDTVENIGGLRREAVGSGGNFQEIFYADGLNADDKAQQVADFLLQRQYFYTEGGYKLNWDPNGSLADFFTQLGSLIDRIQIVVSPTAGIYKLVDFTNERARDNFEPERELDRKTLQGGLVPGQQELRDQAEVHRKLAASLRQNPKFISTFEEMLNGTLGSTQPLQTVFVPGAIGQWPAGSVLRKNDTVTNPTLADAVDETHKIFVGVTTRHNEILSAPTKIQHTGRGLALVKGPVAVNDAVGLSGSADRLVDGGNYLIKDGDPGCAKALQEITATSIELIAVNFGVGGGGKAGMNYRGLWVAGTYNTQDVALLQAGVSAGSYVCVANGITSAPDSGSGWVQLGTLNPYGQWL